jgi:hypothetical protein
MNDNLKSALIAVFIMAIVIGLGVLYGILLEKNYYLPPTY